MSDQSIIKSIIPIEHIASRIYFLRGERVMLDFDLAELYGVETKRLNEQVKRNIERFPKHFMFQLSQDELKNWRSQFATSNSGMKMGLRRAPFAFTEHGTLMLSSILNSGHAIKTSIAIIDAFVRLRKILASNEELSRKVAEHDRHIANIYDYIEQLLKLPENNKKPIGYIWDEEERK